MTFSDPGNLLEAATLSAGVTVEAWTCIRDRRIPTALDTWHEYERQKPKIAAVFDSLDTWHEYERQKPKIAAVFDSFDTNKTGKLEADQLKKFDTNKTGKLEADQLKKLLTELNEGIEAPDEEVRKLLSELNEGVEAPVEEVKWVMEAVDGALDGVDATGGVNRTQLLAPNV
ncbi:hypothetical protein T484DRAFT_1918262 [Baffinella frigidus]|nr:hypothetical protein T484DRAFT_1918262 [Cryptophyta sp. CCMP2293]